MRDIAVEDIRGMVEDRKNEIIEWTKKVIAFPSENRPPIGYEADMQAFILNQCRDLGMKVDSFSPTSVKGAQKHPWWLKGREYSQGRNNVAAVWKGTNQKKSLLFSGHADVAPFEPGEWKITEPFTPKIIEGKLYGRGSADLKGGMAAAFWAIKILKEMGFKPGGDIIFESVVDEEFAGGNGTLASRIKGYNTDLAILVEPTRMEVCTACQGAFLGDITLKGRAGMPYMGLEIANPIYGASSLIDTFRQWGDQWIARHQHPLFGEKGKELKILLWDINSKSEDEFTQMGTPLVANLSWIVWCYPGTDEQKFKQDFIAFWQKQAEQNPDLKPFKLEHKFTYHYVRPWEISADHDAVKEVLNSYQQYSGKAASIGGAAFSCDMAIYGEVGNMPTVILGPRGDNLHAPDEWVLVEDIISLTGIFANLACNWTA
ncbi:MAG: M20/M25/M40 family metallo-hydrolase [Actinomycetota bacterium]|nr:M20/M25/M40 family metallo-hydrolase [Actinomycetota bacterium]